MHLCWYLKLIFYKGACVNAEMHAQSLINKGKFSLKYSSLDMLT